MAIERKINEHGIPVYSGVEPNTKLNDLKFHNVDMPHSNDFQVALHTNLGSLTVLTRMTGFGWMDTESGYRDPEGKFWLASGNKDVERSPAETFQEAVDWVKEHANTCVEV